MRPLTDLIIHASQEGAHDIIVKSHHPGCYTLDGQIIRVDLPVISGSVVSLFLDKHLPQIFKQKWINDGQVDFSYSLQGLRFRVNGFRQRGLVSLVMRRIRSGVLSLPELGFESAPFETLMQHKDGVILVSGAAGSGKSTTVAAMLNWVNQNLQKHIITIEDPVEYLFADNQSVIQQREVGVDVPSFSLALKSALRQAPDIIFLGELRDRETFEMAVNAAETGHLVIATMHAGSVQQSMERLFDFFTMDHQEQARKQMAGCLRGIVCQRLIPVETGRRFPVSEFLVMNPAIIPYIVDGDFTSVSGYIETGESSCHSFNADIFRLIKAGTITKAQGLKFSPDSAALSRRLGGIVFSHRKIA